jgi:hypothetical protein
MEPELKRRLQHFNKTQLLLLLQELTARHPQMLADVNELLEQIDTNAATEDDGEEDVNEKKTDEDWDFNGEFPTYKTLPRSRLLPLDLEAYRQRFARYDTIEMQEETIQEEIDQELLELLKEGEARVDHRDYHAALDLFALLINARIAETNPDLLPLLDHTIDDGMPVLETLLSEVSSHILFDTSVALSPLLSPPMRREWLTRLFTLWLKRLDRHYNEEELPEIILDIAWSDDVTLLHELTMKELHYPEENPKIVDFAHQYRMRALEKFLKELPHI